MYPVGIEADWSEGRNRLTTFFRLILAIPIMIVAIVWELLGGLAVIAAWFVVLVTGRYPQGLYDFVVGVLRFITRANGYLYLLYDQYPPFGINDDDQYPLRLQAPAPQESYSRVKVFFRLILIIPAAIGVYIAGLVSQLFALIAWFIVLFTGKLSKGLHGIMAAALGYQTRVAGYGLLLTDAYPPLFEAPTPPGRITGGGAEGEISPALG